MWKISQVARFTKELRHLNFENKKKSEKMGKYVISFFIVILAEEATVAVRQFIKII